MHFFVCMYVNRNIPVDVTSEFVGDTGGCDDKNVTSAPVIEKQLSY